VLFFLKEIEEMRIHKVVEDVKLMFYFTEGRGSDAAKWTADLQNGFVVLLQFVVCETTHYSGRVTSGEFFAHATSVKLLLVWPKESKTQIVDLDVNDLNLEMRRREEEIKRLKDS
jgi:hypothetical protein